MSNDLISRGEADRLLRAYADEVGCRRGEYELANGILKAACFLSDNVNVPTAYDVENPWILCSEKLPEEPEEIPTEDEPVEEMMLDGKFKEYIVAIWGAYESTTLYYIGNNEWYDGISGTYYKVIAWQPMPEVYKGLDR